MLEIRNKLSNYAGNTTKRRGIILEIGAICGIRSRFEFIGIHNSGENGGMGLITLREPWPAPPPSPISTEF